MRASSRADSVAKRRSLDHPAPQPCRAAERIDEAGFVAGFKRHAERGEGGLRQPRAGQQRLQAGAAAVVQQRGDPRRRQAGQFRKRMVEQFEIA